MSTRAICYATISTILLTPHIAAHVDGIQLTVSRGVAPDEVRLDWIGGQPTFQVYRSPSPIGVVAPGNLIGEPVVRTWSDAPGPSSSISFYEISIPCMFNTPEICDGLLARRSLEVAGWIQGRCITASGAIVKNPTPSTATIDPWFANEAGLGLLKAPSTPTPATTTVANLLAWELSRVNPDGTIDWYTVTGLHSPNEIETAGDITSHPQDNRLGSLLSLARAYLDKTNDLAFFQTSNRLTTLASVANKLYSLVQPDGLTDTWPRPPDENGSRPEYLEDNINVYAGFRDYAFFLVGMGQAGSSTWSTRAAAVRNAIEFHLFDSTTRNYRPYKGSTETDPRTFYADAVGNIYGLTGWKLPEQEVRAVEMWEDHFRGYQGKWAILDIWRNWECTPDTDFPWAKVANAAIVAGDKASAILFESNLRETFDPTNVYFIKSTVQPTFDWNTAEAGDYLAYLGQVGDFVIVDSDIAVPAGGTTATVGVSTSPEDGSLVEVAGVWTVRSVSVVDETGIDAADCLQHRYYRPHAGPSYLHDGNLHGTTKSVRFIPNLPAAGNYEVRIVFADDPNRQHSVRVTTHDGAGAESVTLVDMSKKMSDINSHSIGVFSFGVGTTAGWVEVTNTVPSGVTPGYVIADAVIFIKQ